MIIGTIFIFSYYKGIWILESGKCLLVESGILQNFVLESAINHKKSGIPLTIGNQHPSSTNVQRIRNPESMSWNPESQTVLNSLTWGDRIRLVEKAT